MVSSALDHVQTTPRYTPSDSGDLSRHVQSTMRSEAPSRSPKSEQLPSHLSFSHDIYGSPSQVKSVEKELLNTKASDIHFTTPAQDAKNHKQPDFYLNAEGKLVKNPHALPHKNGPLTIEVEGNNSAKQAKQYADQQQKKAVQELINMFKKAHPGEKIPEMWQSLVDSKPDSEFPNGGDKQNNDTVTNQQEQAYDGGTSAPASAPSDPSEDNSPVDSSSGTPSDSAPSDGSGSAPASDGGSPSGYSSDSPGATASSSLPNAVTGDGGASTAGLDSGPASSEGLSNFGKGPAQTQSESNIANGAEQYLGQAMWGGWAGASGVEGCAASVSQVLDDISKTDPSIFTKGGLHNAQDDNVNGLQADLIANGWTVTTTPQPGDVWIGRGGVSSGHTGIVGNGETLLNNNSSDGKFSKDPLSMTNEWTNSVYLKPPSK